METSPLPNPNSTRDERAAFINYLLKLASADKPERKDRAAIADLRGSLRGTPADYYRASKHVVPFLGESASPSDRWFFLVGGLLALHPQHRQGITFGQAFRQIRDESGSMDTRFLALLNTRDSALPNTLRQMVSLLQTKGEALDYLILLKDLCSWNDPENRVQKRWARDYFRKPETPKTTSETDTDNTTSSGENEQ